MAELNQEEKELILVALSNSLADPEQSDIHKYVTELYEKLRLSWLTDPTGYHTASEIEQIRVHECGLRMLL